MFEAISDTENDISVEIEGLYKKYCRRLKTSLKYGMQDLINDGLARKSRRGTLRASEFWALKDINLKLKRRESLGIVGVNGSGKTTLLNILNGLLKPDRGKVTISGEVGALIQLGAGFNDVLSGRENIYINASIIGVPTEQISQKIDEIIDFSELGDFIDTPVRTYSKGMKMRLGFSVATCLINPDVLLIDEVLAAGDIAFRRKCQNRINQIVDSGTSLILVSHSNRQIEILCQKAMFLNKGIVEAYGDTSDVIQEYTKFTNQKMMTITQPSTKKNSKGSATLWEHSDIDHFEVKQVEVVNVDRQATSNFFMLETLVVQLHILAKKPVTHLGVKITFLTMDGIAVCSVKTQQNSMIDWIGSGVIECVIPELTLREGAYCVDVFCVQREGGTTDRLPQNLFKAENAVRFSVLPDEKAYKQVGNKGLVYMPATWNNIAIDLNQELSQA